MRYLGLALVLGLASACGSSTNSSEATDPSEVPPSSEHVEVGPCPPAGYARMTGVEIATDAAMGEGRWEQNTLILPSGATAVRVPFRVLAELEAAEAPAQHQGQGGASGDCAPTMPTNAVRMGEATVTVDRAVRFGDAELPPGSNLMEHQSFDGSMHNISMPTLHPDAIGEFHVRTGFAFEDGAHTFTLTWPTEGGGAITHDVSVRFGE